MACDDEYSSESLSDWLAVPQSAMSMQNDTIFECDCDGSGEGIIPVLAGAAGFTSSAPGNTQCITLADWGVDPADLEIPIPVSVYFDEGFSAVTFTTENGASVVGTVGDNLATASLPNDGSSFICATVTVDTDNNANDVSFFAVLPNSPPGAEGGFSAAGGIDDELVGNICAPVEPLALQLTGDPNDLVDLDISFAISEVNAGDPRTITFTFDACGVSSTQTVNPEPLSPDQNGFSIFTFTLPDVPGDCDEITYEFCSFGGEQSYTIPFLVVGSSCNCPADIYDLALEKELSPGQGPGFRPGDQVSFDITVLNQSTAEVFDIVVGDSIPPGMTFVSATPSGNLTTNLGATVNYTNNYTLANDGSFAIDNLASGDEVTFTVTATIDADASLPLINFAEIQAFDDDNDPGNAPPIDVDSTPDMDFGNDAGGVPGGNSDGATGGDGTGAPGVDDAATDEDDSDPALVPVFDLALTKSLDPGSISPTGNYPGGTDVTFNITVCNQGTEDVNNVVIKDYVPCGLDVNGPINDGLNPGWTAISPNGGQSVNDSVFFTITTPIPAGECTQIQLVSRRRFAAGTNAVCPVPIPEMFLTNQSEILQFEDLMGNMPVDFDSTPDGDSDNDSGGMVNDATDNIITGNGTGAPGDNNPATDEDDADPAGLDVFDLAIFKVIDPVVSPGPYAVGDIVKFDLGIISQGNISAQEVVVTDLSPPGLSFDPAFGMNTATGWDGANPTSPTLSITDFTGLIPADPASSELGFMDTAIVSIWLRVEAVADISDPANYTNFGELTSAGFINPMTGMMVMVTSDGDSPYGLGIGNDTGGGVGTDDDNETTDDMPGEDIDSQDPAFVPLQGLSVGSTVFLDENNDGMLNNTDAGIPGVEVQLFNAATGMQVLTDANGVPVQNAADAQPVLTDTDGNYFFSNLGAGDYFIVIPTTPANAPISSSNGGIPFMEADINDNIDNDDDGLQPGGAGTAVMSGVFSLSAGQEPTEESGIGGDQDEQPGFIDANGNMTIDFGFFAPVSVGDLAFFDVDLDNVQSGDDIGIGNLTAVLIDNMTGDTVMIDANGNMISGVMTTSDGFYIFTNLPPGDYSVQFDLSTVLGAEFYDFVTPDVGNDDGLDSDGVVISDSTSLSGPTGPLAGGEADLTLDVGIFCITEVLLPDPFTSCGTALIPLTDGISITPDTSATFGAEWSTTDGTGTFVDEDGTVLSAPFDYADVVGYLPSSEDVARGAVNLVLTTDDPLGLCEPVSESIMITLLQVDCGQFPWGGQD